LFKRGKAGGRRRETMKGKKERKLAFYTPTPSTHEANNGT
jgi:hypothetical protein